MGIVNSLALRRTGGTVAAVMLDAWTQFLADSHGFKAWEDANLAALFTGSSGR
jgi:hypothetical protein